MLFDLDSIPTEIFGEFEKELRRGWHRDRVMARVNQANTIRRMNAAGARSMDGVGRLRMRIDPTSFHYWGQRLGYDCWNDEQFLREYERDNADSRVKCSGTRIQVGHERNVKWFKNYGAC